MAFHAQILNLHNLRIIFQENFFFFDALGQELIAPNCIVRQSSGMQQGVVVCHKLPK